jgi:hypothetical protein
VRLPRNTALPRPDVAWITAGPERRGSSEMPVKAHARWRASFWIERLAGVPTRVVTNGQAVECGCCPPSHCL